MSIKALQDYTYYAKYARYNEEAGRRETWSEAVERVKRMHLTKYASKIELYPQLRDEMDFAFEASRQKLAVGSQRCLQFGGKPILDKNARAYNCTVSYCDRVRFFQESLFLLLCGAGVGFSVQRHHIAELPNFSHRSNDARTFVIPDSIEGWANALGVLIGSYLPHPEFSQYEGCDVEFDYSLIRPAGAPISSGAGKAPGPEPLKRSLKLIKGLLKRCVASGSSRLRPIDAYDIVMHASDAVLSGGVRRSATICLFSLDDKEMATAKTGNWLFENPQRGRSNNSVVLIKNKTTFEEFNNLMQFVKEFGEPGFVWTDSTEHLVNPCCEISFVPRCYETGESGWHFCNLCEINGRKIKSERDWARAARAAAILGTLQAGYTDFDYLGPVTKRIVEREALLGVSITGMMDNPEILFDPNIQREMARLVLSVNAQIAAMLGINPTARATCVKPAGTTSCVLGTASGIHPHHAKRYFRRVQGNVMETPLQFYKGYNAAAVEKSVWSANGTDEVITFCINVPEGAKVKNDLDAISMLEHVKLTQQNWVASGKVESRCVEPWLTHNVSNTINVRQDEWDTVADFIYENRMHFCGISLLPVSGDLDYPQAPMTTVHTSAEIAKIYGEGSLFASGLIVDGLRAFDDNLWRACEATLGLGETLQDDERYAERQDWIRRAKQFASRYFDKDLRKCLYCLKEVHNWKLWCDLQRETVEVDYTLMSEDEDVTKPMQEWACSGGSCVLI